MIEVLRLEYPEMSLRTLCSLTGVSRSWLYSRSSLDEDHIALRDAIEEIVLEFPGYGYRRVTHALQRQGRKVNHKRILRIMRKESLLCQLKRHFVPTTDSEHGFRRYPNLIKDRVVDELDRVWVADITYIRLPTAFVYLATILDACSRRCVGWELSHQLNAQLTIAALENALRERLPGSGLIHHSDQGVQYASADYVLRLTGAGVQISMAAVGNPYENALAERFFRTLKHEEVHLKRYQTDEEARANIKEFIEDVYNKKRLHSALGYLPPSEFEQSRVSLKSKNGLLELVR